MRQKNNEEEKDHYPHSIYFILEDVIPERHLIKLKSAPFFCSTSAHPPIFVSS